MNLWNILKMSKISPSDIVEDHFKSLKGPGLDSWISFLILPLLISLGFIAIGFDINKDSIETIVGSLAIFVGLLFNAMVMLLDIARKHKGVKVKKQIVKTAIVKL